MREIGIPTALASLRELFSSQNGLIERGQYRIALISFIESSAQNEEDFFGFRINQEEVLLNFGLCSLL